MNAVLKTQVHQKYYIHLPSDYVYKVYVTQKCNYVYTWIPSPYLSARLQISQFLKKKIQNLKDFRHFRYGIFDHL